MERNGIIREPVSAQMTSKLCNKLVMEQNNVQIKAGAPVLVATAIQSSRQQRQQC